MRQSISRIYVQCAFRKRLNTSDKCMKCYTITKLTYRNADACNRIEHRNVYVCVCVEKAWSRLKTRAISIWIERDECQGEKSHQQTPSNWNVRDECTKELKVKQMMMHQALYAAVVVTGSKRPYMLERSFVRLMLKIVAVFFQVKGSICC